MTGLFVFCWILQFIGIIGSWFFPESPRYLVKTDKIEQAQEVFEIIAEWNKVTNKDIVSIEKIKQDFAFPDEKQQPKEGEEERNLLASTEMRNTEHDEIASAQN